MLASRAQHPIERGGGYAMMIISRDQLDHALVGMPWPARRWQTAAWADFNCASGQVREALRNLPDNTYANIGDLRDTIAAIEQRAEASDVRSLTD
jgi:hypothetical protein